MTILCIETSTSVCSAAICRDGAPIKQCVCLEGSNHARLLPRYIDELLAFAREQRVEIDAVALSEGPGSYTGLRIGTSTAKGLCYGMNIPLIPIPTLEVLREAFMRTEHNVQSTDILVPMIDARRMEVYTVIYNSQSPICDSSQARAVVVENEESLVGGLDTTGKQVYYFGDGAEKCAAVLTKPDWHLIAGVVPEAQYMGRIAERGEKRVIRGEEIAYYEPFYLKEFVAAQSHVKGLKS